ncbi:MAG: type II toxin-antitoxin system VapC family toxin [Gemmatimonadaceae bacterium]
MLLDTGPIVATLDSRDQWHRTSIGAIERYADRCITSEAVVTEACYFASRTGRSGAVALDMLLDLGIPVVSVEHRGLHACARLMDRYASVPMDFADATLVALAEVFTIREVLTLDRRGFAVYRSTRGEPFRVVPAK